MIDVVVNQRPLGFADGLLDRMKLLGEIETRSSLIKHLDHTAKMTFGPPQPFDDIRVSFVNVVVCHTQNISPLGGYGNRCSFNNRRSIRVTQLYPFTYC